MMAIRPDFREHLSEDDKQADASAVSAEEQTRWQGVTSLILAVLSVYFILVPVLNVLLALLAVIFGVWGLRSRTPEKTASVTGIVVGMINVALVLIVSVGVAFIWRLAQPPVIHDHFSPRDEDFHVYSRDFFWRD